MTIIPSLFSPIPALFFTPLLFACAIAYQELDTKNLLSRCCKRSRDWNEVWEEFQRRYDELILTYIWREFRRSQGQQYVSRLNEVLQDLKQEVYIKLLSNNGRALRNFKGTNESSFRAYLYTISRHVFLNHVKQTQKEVQLKDVKVAAADTGFANDRIEPVTSESIEEVEGVLFKEFVVKMLKELHPSKKFDRDLTVFKLYYFDGMSSREISESFDLELSLSGVETVINRMKKALGDCVAKNL